MRRIGVLGAGAWGTALAIAARRAGREVVLWTRRPELAARLNAERRNPDYLPGAKLDAAIEASADLARAAACDALLLAVPAQHMRWIGGALSQLLPKGPDGPPVAICAKGIEQGSGALMTEVLDEVLPGRRLAVLSGPTFAAEVARGLPTAVTLAAADEGLAARLVTALGSSSFRPYFSGDPLGAQLGGALKNVAAIACGVIAGRELGDNARAALITRALAETMRLGTALGAKRETLVGLSGLGDLTLTCTSTLSRNYTLGRALGEGQSLQTIMDGRRSVAEGVFTASAAMDLARRHGVEMPIAQAVDAILNHGAAIDDAIKGLLARPFTAETF
jgi:glycerol-3-phosphate dehydrogenase (NAD(P)+)